jgi:hypothetical protein
MCAPDQLSALIDGRRQEVVRRQEQVGQQTKQLVESCRLELVPPTPVHEHKDGLER